jgi:hypothetical protein
MNRTCGCASDVHVFGHTGCALRPAWAVSPQAGHEHDDADAVQRSAWSRMAMDEVYGMKQRGPETVTAP